MVLNLCCTPDPRGPTMFVLVLLSTFPIHSVVELSWVFAALVWQGEPKEAKRTLIVSFTNVCLLGCRHEPFFRSYRIKKFLLFMRRTFKHDFCSRWVMTRIERFQCAYLIKSEQIVASMEPTRRKIHGLSDSLPYTVPVQYSMSSCYISADSRPWNNINFCIHIPSRNIFRRTTIP